LHPRGLRLANNAHLPAQILSSLIASGSFNSLRAGLLRAGCVGLRSCFAIPLVFELQLLILSLVRNWFRA
jgi:hypothetical protein